MTVAEIVAVFKSLGPADLPSFIDRFEGDPRAQVAAIVNRARKRLEAHEAEVARVGELYAEERRAGGPGIIVGVDEVGRGALAGPLTVCAVVLPETPHILGLDDSKRLSAKRREIVAERIEQAAVAIGIAHIEACEIDACGILPSLRVAMRRAIAATDVEPDCVLVDGDAIGVHPREKNVVKGDARIASIAAASIYAKVTRDAMMTELESEFPQYGWSGCKGYGSAEHLEAIRSHGLTGQHRASFCRNLV